MSNENNDITSFAKNRGEVIVKYIFGKYVKSKVKK